MPSSYRPPHGDFTLVTLTQLAAELGRTKASTRKLLSRLSWVGIRARRDSRGHVTLYEVDDLEALKALLGQPNHAPHPSQTDWLDDYLQGEHHG
jgi:hypothetical protein